MTPKEQILSVIKKGKISGSWLISGPMGTGKKEFASSLANFLTTGQWIDNRSYNPSIKWIECGLTEEAKKEIQKMILAGKEVEENTKTQARKKIISIEDIREGIQFLSLKPTENEYRILIVSLAEDMNPNAANALLKILEEPYPRSVLILISQNTGKLLPTIGSRCRKIVFPQKSFEEILLYLQKKYPANKNNDLIAELADGSIGLADMICEINGLEIYQKLNAFLLPLNQINIEQLNQFIENVIKDAQSYELFQIFLIYYLRKKIKDLAIQKHPKGEILLEIMSDVQNLFNKIDKLNLDKKQSLINIVLRIAGEIE